MQRVETGGIDVDRQEQQFRNGEVDMSLRQKKGDGVMGWCARTPRVRLSVQGIIGTLALLMAVGVAGADNVPAGLDYFYTPATACSPPTAGSYLQFGAGGGGPPAIPAGFFGPGSLPFTGDVCFRGQALGGVFGTADTVVQRQGALNFDCACGVTCDATVPIENTMYRRGCPRSIRKWWAA
jgi:hypothetical protein